EAEPEVVWSTLLGVLGRSFAGVPDWLASAWGLRPRDRSGNWQQSVRCQDTLPGFEVAQADAGHRLLLRGGHRFSQYELCFELDNPAPGRTCLRAQTRAVFPSLSGSLYRALVIGTGGHRVAVRRMLGHVAARSESPRPV